jgi:RNA polymerase sigma factor (sigma-70 family)
MRIRLVATPGVSARITRSCCQQGSSTKEKNRTDAEDVVQEASLRAFCAIRQFSGGSARAWVLRTVRNTACSWLRKNRPATVVTVEDLEAVEALHVAPGDPVIETPEASLIAKVDAKHLRAAIAALPTPFRETLLLREVEGLAYREIAETTDVSIGTVMSRLARARRRLIAATREVMTASRSIATRSAVGRLDHRNSSTCWRLCGRNETLRTTSPAKSKDDKENRRA